MATPRHKLLALLSLALASTGSLGQGFGPAHDSGWYYQIGGAQAVSAPANTNSQTSTLQGSLDLSHIYSCGNFNPISGLANVLNNAQGQVMAAYNGLLTAATSAISSLPAFILQRAAPGLYDLYQNAVIRGEAVLGAANASCQQFEAEIRNGENPYERFIKTAKTFDWKIQMGNGSTGSASSDVNAAKTTVDANNGNNGIPWLGGNHAGGTAQAPVQAISDTVLAGYNIELNRAVNDTSAAPTGNPGIALASVWPKPADVQAYSQFVIGDIELTTSKDQSRKATPGHGIIPLIEQDKAPVLTALRTIVTGGNTPTASELAKVSVPGIDMTREVISAIRALPTAQEREAAMNKLSDEAATGLNLQKALLLRRLLQTGRMEPNIYASGLAPDLDAAINQLTQAIDNVVFETRIRREMFSQTALVLLGQGQGRIRDSAATTNPANHDERPITHGEVQ
ncbi:MAG: integrating conjugative element protein [Candidatus Paceibacterota bacterium]|jgi:integrating conjugative element protein (TIGR03755 family)